MRRSLVVLAAVATLDVATAQQPAAPPAATQAESNASRQQDLKSATEGTAKGYGGAAADGSAKAAREKGQPKVTPDAAAKRQAVKSATAGTAKGYTGAAADSAAVAAKDTSPRKAAPKPKADTPEMRKVVP